MVVVATLARVASLLIHSGGPGRSPSRTLAEPGVGEGLGRFGVVQRTIAGIPRGSAE